MDTIIRGGLIVDGTGAEPFVGDVGIEGDRIVAAGSLDEVEFQIHVLTNRRADRAALIADLSPPAA